MFVLILVLLSISYCSTCRGNDSYNFSNLAKSFTILKVILISLTWYQYHFVFGTYLA